MIDVDLFLYYSKIEPTLGSSVNIVLYSSVVLCLKAIVS